MSAWWLLAVGAFAGFVAGLTVALLAAGFFLWRGTRTAERAEAGARVLAYQHAQRDKAEANAAATAEAEKAAEAAQPTAEEPYAKSSAHG